jgi:hypothetical protein
MIYKYSEQLKELKKLLNELKREYGAVCLKLSCEESGHSDEFIDFVNNRISNEILPLNLKIGGPNAKADIIKGLNIGVSGFIAPMIESSFGVKQYVSALREIIDNDSIDELLISVNLESQNAFMNIEEIISTPEIVYIDQIVIGTTDLAMSVSKSKTNPELLNMVRKIAQKGKKNSKQIRIGGIIGLSTENLTLLEKLLKDTSPERINTSFVCFDVNKMSKIVDSYQKALEFEYKMNQLWLNLKKEYIYILENRVTKSKNKFLNLHS